jgi:hypothetical protein
MSKNDSKNPQELVKIEKTTTWSLQSKVKALSVLYKQWAKERDLPDNFVKKHQESMIVTLYMASIVKSDDAFILLDSLKQDIVGGSQTSETKLWGLKLKAYIILPNNKTVLTSALLRNILKLAGMTQTPAQFSDKDLIENSDQNQFWSGFFSELYSVSPLKKISAITDKTTMYAAGVACMRYELYNMIRKDTENIKGQYWNDIDLSVSGDPKKKSKKYLHTIFSTYSNGPILSRTIGQLLNTYYSALKEQIAKRMVLGSFLKEGVQTLAMLNKHKVEKIAVGKGKKTKTVTKRVVIKPTKPSRLATILAVERNSITELCESAWENLEALRKDFDKTLPLKRNYDSFTKRAKELIDEQWNIKQIVLNSSKSRQGALDSDEKWSTAKKIQEMRKLTSSVELVNNSVIKDIETLYITLFSKLKLVNEEKFTIATLKDFISSEKLNKQYPITAKLMRDVLEIKTKEPLKVVLSEDKTESLA